MAPLWSTVLSVGMLVAAGSPAQMLVLHLDPQRTSVAVSLRATLHTVRGTLGPASGRIAFDPASGLATGEVVIDLTAAETGIARRDKKMHAKILETDRFPVAVFKVERIDLPASLRQGENDLQLHGTLDFHGSTRPISMPAVATLEGDRVTATAWLEVPYVDWGLDDPSFFILRVAKIVRVEIEAAGRLEGELPDPVTTP